MRNTITITRPTNQFGSAITETTVGFPAQRLTKEEAQKFMAQLKEAVEKM